MIIAIRAQSTRRTSMTFFQQASRCGTFSAGLLTRRPDANTFPKHRRVWHSCHTHASCKVALYEGMAFFPIPTHPARRCIASVALLFAPDIRAAHSCGTVGDSHPIPF